MATYTGQNLGGGKPERIREGMRKGLVMAISIAAAIALSMVFLGKFFLMLFISGTPEETAQVLKFSYTFLMFMAGGLPVLYMLYMYRSALQGMGDTVVPMLSGVVELVMRISAVLILPYFVAEYGVYIAEVAAWTGAAILLGIMYYVRLGRLLKA